MNKLIKKSIFAIALIFTFIFFGVTSVSAAENTFSLGTFDSSTMKFNNASGTGTSKYKSLLIAYGKNPVSGENLILPTVSGFTKSTSASTNYSTVIKMEDGKTLGQIADYVKQITFNNSPSGQMIQIVISEEVLDTKTFYYEGNQHYYQYIPYTDSDDKTWFSAYESAKNSTYGGRQGYLATVTNVNEDIFIYNAATEVGWLGGTTIKYSSENGNLYYNYDVAGINDSRASINYDDRVDISWSSGIWYWADGPERGQTIYPTITRNTSSDSSYVNQGYYFNWNSGEPNNGAQYNYTSKENCLATLRIGAGYSTGSNISNYSWNDIPYGNLNMDAYKAKGYFVEYGDQTIGDSGSNNTTDIIASANITFTYTVTFKDYNGTVLKTQENVEYGTGATAPSNPTREGYTFTGWDKSFTNITANTDVTAQYEINKYTVTFKDYDGTVLKTQNNVEYNTSATAPSNPTRDHYTFTGWDKSFDNVTEDLVVTAQYILTPGEV